ncbi:octaprenyl diphosphate synthase [Hahella sp. CCB-MM4]|uniref:polyprenyl synthetase family protein n=1 Tax=Hahella sp. (strain CCB-MM4) TaxID=1926491 RepID=UPI000B9C3C4D|nr:polyprenyl synthetase family protein [Hahella sp. CCB-MM4]OZG71461.1 octaprenyl diphosphate synthase [Hahella sp. CCB-MM4]
MQAELIYSTVSDDFAAVDELITSQLFSRVPLVERIGQYIVESGGKRLRPLLVLLVSNAVHNSNPDYIKLAAIIEFLHTATLLHDDVVDTSSLRRGRDTANAKWGNAPSVLVGDFLYSRAFQMMVELGSLEVMQILSDATNVIAEGEVLQLTNCKNPDITHAQYMDVITAKTAKLFEAASHSAAALANCTQNQQKAAQIYGLELGIAFQLVDDVLDYTGNAADMGKNVGDDLAEGKPTLPLLFAQEHSSAEDRQLIRKAIREGGLENLDDILEVVRRSGALEFTMEQARRHVDNAIAQLELLSPGQHRDAMLHLAQFAVNRNK